MSIIEILFGFFFFFKQKTAYEMRISDWSSDVCSSDLVYMYTVRLEHRDDDKHKPGEPGQQPDGSYITPEGERLTTEEDKATYLRTAQDWIVTPLLKNTPGLAGVD